MISFKWPPQNNSKIVEAVRYLKYEKISKKGYPEIVEKFEKKFKKMIGTKYAPEETKKTMNKIYSDDVKIAKLLKKLNS